MTRETENARHTDALARAIDALEAQRSRLGDQAVDAMIAAVVDKLAGRPAEEVERRALVIVLFADLVGFTTLAGSKDIEEVKEIMRAYFSKCAQAIERFGGYIEKYIGDAVMAVFGIREDSEDAPAHAVRAGLQIIDSVHELATLQGGESDPNLAVRIGVNTGVVLLGQGGASGDDIKVVGDTVNTASRLQGTASPDSILIGPGTYAHVSGLFECEALGPIALKGKTSPLEAFRVVRAKPRSFHAARHPTGFRVPTVGREEELAALEDAFEAAAGGRGLRLVMISGEAGVGKTRLLEDFQAWLAEHPEHVWFLRGRGWSHTQRTSYFVLRDILASRCDLGDDEPLNAARAKLTRLFVETLGPRGEEAAAIVGHLVGIDFSSSPWVHASASDHRQLRGRAEVLLREYFRLLTPQGPVVLLLEDLHWADDETLDMLESLCAGLLTERLCVMGATRPSLWERRQSWGPAGGMPAGHHVHLELKPLARDMAGRLVRELLGEATSVPAWLTDTLVERGEGHPYFTEELVRWIVEQGVLRKDGQSWHAPDRAPPNLPFPQQSTRCFRPAWRARTRPTGRYWSVPG